MFGTAQFISDVNAMLAVADNDPAARKGTFGVVGFCMSGGLALAVARANTQRPKYT
jgi:dienelactone hydrolase